MREEFNKVDLKNGMVVELRKGQKRFIIETEGRRCLYNKNFLLTSSLIHYNDDLCSIYNCDDDIVRVFEPVNNVLEWDKQKLIWQRKEVTAKEQLEKELSKLLGAPVEIVEFKKEKNKNEHICTTPLHDCFNHSYVNATKKYVGEKKKEEDERFVNDFLDYYFNHLSASMIEEYLRRVPKEKK